MGTITIINNSSFADYSAVMRVGRFLAGDEYYSVHNERGEIVVSIKKQSRDTYLIVDAQ